MLYLVSLSEKSSVTVVESSFLSCSTKICASGLLSSSAVYKNTNGGLVVVIGINPSIAGKKDKAGRSKSDKTLTKTSKVMHELGFGRLVMVNLFESQTSHTENINFSTQINLGKHRELFDEANEIFVAWGRKGWLAPAIGEARKVLAEYEDKLWCIEHNGRKPFHPRAWAYNDEWEIVPFSFGAVSF